MSWDVELERTVLSRCLKDRPFLSQAFPLLEEIDFSSESFAWIWICLAEVFEKHRELADPSVLFTRIDREFPDVADRERLEDTLSALYSASPSSPHAALDEIRRFVKMSAARRAADGVFDGIEDGDMDAVESALDDGSMKIRRAGLIAQPTSWTASAESRLERYKSYARPGVLRTFATMSPTINRLAMAGGGLPIGKMAEIMSTTNVGKTSFLVDIGYNAIVRSQAAVIHVSSEDPMEEVEARYDARFLGIDRDRLMAGDIKAHEAEHYRKKFIEAAELNDSLFVHYLPKGHKVTMVGPLVEMVRQRHPYKPILLCYDSPYHAAPPSKKTERRHELREIIEYVDNLTKDASLGLGPVGCWFTHHARRKDAGKAPTAESGAESYDIERSIDFGIGLREGEAIKSNEYICIEGHIMKNRLGKLKKAVIYFEARLGTCRFDETSYTELYDADDA